MFYLRRTYFHWKKSKDQDGNSDNHSITVAVGELTFGDDEMSQALNLDESTTVDPGDYLALYTDLNSGTPEYGEITKVGAEWYGLYPGISDGFFRRDAGGYGCVSEGPGGRR